MDERKFVKISCIIGITLILVWVVMFAFMSQYSKIPLVIGSFVVGWYLRKIFDSIIEVLKSDSKGSIDSKRGSKPLRTE